MKIKPNVVHMEGWKPKQLQTSCNVVINMTKTKNSCKTIQT
jgi:hypothetical protein